RVFVPGLDGAIAIMHLRTCCAPSRSGCLDIIERAVAVVIIVGDVAGGIGGGGRLVAGGLVGAGRWIDGRCGERARKPGLGGRNRGEEIAAAVISVGEEISLRMN